MSNEQHHKWGFSRWPYFKHCPHFKGSSGTTEEAYRGTLQHHLLEAIGNNDEEAKVKYASLLKPEEIENVEYVWARVEKLIKENPNAELIFEHKVSVMSATHWETITGTSDVSIIGGDKDPDGVVIIDAKFGSVKDYDPQLRGYATAVMQSTGKKRALYCTAYGMEKKYEYGMIGFDEGMKEIDKQIGILKDVETDHSSHPRKVNVGCKYCAYEHSCPEMIGSVVAAAEFDVNGFDSDEARKLVSSVDSSVDLKTVDIDVLGNLMAFFKMVSDQSDSIKGILKERIAAGEECTTYKLQLKQGSQYITSNTGLRDAVVDRVLEVRPDITEQGALDAFTDTGKFSLSGVRKLLFGDAANRKASKDKFDEMFGHLLGRGEGTSSIVKRTTKEIKEILNNSKKEIA